MRHRSPITASSTVGLDVPLHPTWSNWLEAGAAHSGEARRLDAIGILAYRGAPDPATISPRRSGAGSRTAADGAS